MTNHAFFFLLLSYFPPTKEPTTKDSTPLHSKFIIYFLLKNKYFNAAEEQKFYSKRGQQREQCFNNTVPNLIRKISKVAVTLLQGRANIYIYIYLKT